MATVYLATDLRLERSVAIKVLRPDLAADPGFLTRFGREARSTARLSHPHVVAVFDYDDEPHAAYLVLEYVPGHTLRDVLQQGPLTPAQALAVLDSVLEALAAAHEAGVVHRDIKPENILIGKRDRIKVADFGVARAMDGPDSRTTEVLIGTAAYVSPEHVAGDGTDAASDIYSSGILLYEMLTGQPPFVGDNALSVAYQHVNGEVGRPSALVPDLPTELDDLVLGATAREPDDRFADAEEFLTRVRRVRALLPPPEPLPALPLANQTVVLERQARRGGPDHEATAELGAGQPGGDGATQSGLAMVDAVMVDAAGKPELDEVVLRDGNPRTQPPGTAVTGATPPAVPSPRNRKPRSKWAMATMILVITGLVAAGLGWAFAAGPLQRASVPNIVGMTEAEAEELLAQSELRLEVSEREFNETLPAGVVLSQDPADGGSTFLRFPVSAVVSLGPERYAVPDVRGAEVASATDSITSTKLLVTGQTEAYDEEVPAGLVAGTDPAIGSSLKRDTAVTLIVSLGPAPVPVPDLLGVGRDEAVAALEGLGLVAATGEEYSEQYAAGTVMAVDPPIGQEVEKGTTVTLTISQGPPPVEVPRVVDMRRGDAVELLRSKGFQVRVQEGIVTPLDRVYSQDPPPGEVLPKGSTVTISIF